MAWLGEHLFSAERICRERMTIQTFANFVSKSYGYGKGGGAIYVTSSGPVVVDGTIRSDSDRQGTGCCGAAG